MFEIMWEAEKRSVAQISDLWKQLGTAQKFIIDLANTGDLAAIQWLTDHGLSGEIRPSLRIKS